MIKLVNNQIVMYYKGRELVFDKSVLEYQIPRKSLPIDLRPEAELIDGEIQRFVDTTPLLKS